MKIVFTAVALIVIFTLSSCSSLIVKNIPDTLNQKSTITETTTITSTITESWSTYMNSVYKYSIEYPISWYYGTSEGDTSVAQLNSVVIASTQSAYVCVFTYLSTQSVYSFVDSIIEWSLKNMNVFQVISRSNTTWHGKYQACEWTFIYQLDTDSPLIMEKNLSLESDGYVYEVFGKSNYSEFESYSSTFDKIINSFLMMQ
jgi:hypothetical protein